MIFEYCDSSGDKDHGPWVQHASPRLRLCDGEPHQKWVCAPHLPREASDKAVLLIDGFPKSMDFPHYPSDTYGLRRRSRAPVSATPAFDECTDGVVLPSNRASLSYRKDRRIGGRTRAASIRLCSALGQSGSKGVPSQICIRRAASLSRRDLLIPETCPESRLFCPRAELR